MAEKKRNLKSAANLSVDGFSTAAVETALRGHRLGRSVLRFDVVDSTNDVAWDSARQGRLADGLVVVADAQRKGRGRLGRKWDSRPAVNLLFSVLVFDAAETPLPHEPLPIAAGVAVAEAIEQVAKIRPMLKWPNDVQIEGQKVSGVLVERRQLAGNTTYVIGMGINIADTPPREDLRSPATSLAACCQNPPSRQQLLIAILIKMDDWLKTMARGEMAELQQAWNSRCSMLQHRIVVQTGGKELAGRVLDIDPLHGLVLQDDLGGRTYLPAATTSIISIGE